MFIYRLNGPHSPCMRWGLTQHRRKKMINNIFPSQTKPETTSYQGLYPTPIHFTCCQHGQNTWKTGENTEVNSTLAVDMFSQKWFCWRHTVQTIIWNVHELNSQLTHCTWSRLTSNVRYGTVWTDYLLNRIAFDQYPIKAKLALRNEDNKDETRIKIDKTNSFKVCLLPSKCITCTTARLVVLFYSKAW